MRPLALLLAVSCFTVLSYAQTTTTGTAQPGLVITSGYATVTGPVSPPMLVTPTANLGLASSSPVGATSGTSNNQVGASNMTLPSAPLPAVQSVVQLNNPNMIGLAQPVVMQAAIPEQATEERTGIDAGAAQFGFSHIGGTVDRRSLGEIAKERKGQPRLQAARVFTNEDVRRLHQQQPGTTVGPRGAQPENPNPTLPQR